MVINKRSIILKYILLVPFLCLCNNPADNNANEAFDCSQPTAYGEPRESDSTMYFIMEINDTLNNKVNKHEEGVTPIPDNVDLFWNGKDFNGNTCPPGNYLLKVTIWYGTGDSVKVMCDTIGLNGWPQMILR